MLDLVLSIQLCIMLVQVTVGPKNITGLAPSQEKRASQCAKQSEPPGHTPAHTGQLRNSVSGPFHSFSPTFLLCICFYFVIDGQCNCQRLCACNSWLLKRLSELVESNQQTQKGATAFTRENASCDCIPAHSLVKKPRP